MLIGTEYGMDGAKRLKAKRAPHYALFRTIKKKEGDEVLVLITNKGTFLAQAKFVATAHFEIINAHWIDFEYQTLRSVKHPFPIVVVPGMTLEFT